MPNAYETANRIRAFSVFLVTGKLSSDNEMAAVDETTTTTPAMPDNRPPQEIELEALERQLAKFQEYKRAWNAELQRLVHAEKTNARHRTKPRYGNSRNMAKLNEAKYQLARLQDEMTAKTRRRDELMKAMVNGEWRLARADEIRAAAIRASRKTFTPIIKEKGDFRCNGCYLKNAVNDYAHLGSVCDACLDQRCRVFIGKPWSGKTTTSETWVADALAEDKAQ